LDSDPISLDSSKKIFFFENQIQTKASKCPEGEVEIKKEKGWREMGKSKCEKKKEEENKTFERKKSKKHQT